MQSPPDADGPPGEPSLRGMLGLVPDLVSDDPVEVAVKLRDRYGYVVRFPGVHPALDSDIYLVTHPEEVRRMLQTEPSTFGPLDVPGSRAFGRVVENSIVSLTPDDESGSWIRRTRMLHPEFAEEAVHGAVPRLVRTTLAALAEFGDGHAGGDAPGAVPAAARVWAPDGRDGVRLLPAMRRLSLRLLGDSLLGADVRVHEVEVIDAVDTLRAQFKRRQLDVVTGRLSRRLPDELRLPGFLGDHLGDPSIRLDGRGERRTRAAVDQLAAAADSIVARRERTPLAFGDGPGTWLVRPDPVTGETLAPGVLRQEVVGLLIAGHATTSAALAWAFYLLAGRPEAQERIRSEARETALLSSPEPAREAGLDAPEDPGAFLDALSYTRRVWQETLRLYPALPLFGRTAREDVTLGGADVPAGARLLVSPFVTHRDPAFWADPERFDPDRFLPERAADRPEFAYYPFSGGRHACLGEAVATTEALAALAATLATHRVEFAGEWEGSPPEGPDVGVDSAINLEPEREVVVRFVPRE